MVFKRDQTRNEFERCPINSTSLVMNDLHRSSGPDRNLDRNMSMCFHPCSDVPLFYRDSRSGFIAASPILRHRPRWHRKLDIYQALDGSAL
jgi:hypothetical protein